MSGKKLRKKIVRAGAKAICMELWGGVPVREWGDHKGEASAALDAMLPLIEDALLARLAGKHIYDAAQAAAMDATASLLESLGKGK